MSLAYSSSETYRTSPFWGDLQSPYSQTPPLNKADVLSGETAESRADVVPVWSGQMKTTLEGARSESRSGYRQRYRLPPSGNGQAGAPRRDGLDVADAEDEERKGCKLFVAEAVEPVDAVRVVWRRALRLRVAT